MQTRLENDGLLFKVFRILLDIFIFQFEGSEVRLREFQLSKEDIIIKVFILKWELHVNQHRLRRR